MLKKLTPRADLRSERQVRALNQQHTAITVNAPVRASTGGTTLENSMNLHCWTPWINLANKALAPSRVPE